MDKGVTHFFTIEYRGKDFSREPQKKM